MGHVATYYVTDLRYRGWGHTNAIFCMSKLSEINIIFIWFQGTEWKASNSEAALTRKSGIKSRGNSINVDSKIALSSDVIATESGYVHSPHVNRLLSVQRASVPAELALKTSSNWVNSQPQIMALTPSQKGRAHRHRKAVRRVRSTADAGSLARCCDSDPREPRISQDVVALRQSAVLRCLQSEKLDRNLGEGEMIALEVFKTVSHTQPSSSRKLDPDVSSLSSYKETSPETEINPTFTQILKSVVYSANDVGRSRTFAHSRDSLETYKGRTHRKSLEERTLKETAIVHVEPKCSSKSIGNEALDLSPKAVRLSTLMQANSNVLVGDPALDSENIQVKIDPVESKPGDTPRSNQILFSVVDETVSNACDNKLILSVKTVKDDLLNLKDARRKIKNKMANSFICDTAGILSSTRIADDKESSMVGLDWLFTTDSDTQSSG